MITVAMTIVGVSLVTRIGNGKFTLEANLTCKEDNNIEATEHSDAGKQTAEVEWKFVIF